MADHNLTLSDGIEPEDEPEMTVAEATNARMSITDTMHIVCFGPDGEIKQEYKGKAV